MRDKDRKFINRSRAWELSDLIGLLREAIIRKIGNIPIPVLDVSDKIV